jgi:hypothetical protein
VSGHEVHDFWPMLDTVAALVERGATDEEVLGLVLVPVQGSTTAEQRVAQARTIVNFWTPELLEDARLAGAGWHALLEPAARGQAGAFELAHTMLEHHGRWPRPDEFRRAAGVASGHRLPGETPGQEALL